MKKWAFRLLLIGIVLGTMALRPLPDSGYRIAVEVKGMPDGMCKLIGTIGDRNFLADSAMIAQGKAVFSGEKALHGGLYYVVFPNNKNIQVLLDEDQEFSLKTNSVTPVLGMQVEGSLDNQLLYQNLQFETAFQKRYQENDQQIQAAMVGSNQRKALEEKRDKLLQERKAHLQSFAKNHPQSFFTTFKLSGQNPDLTYPQKENGDLDTLMQVYAYRNAFWDNTDLTDERLLYTPIIVNKLKTYLTQITDQRIDSVIKYADIVIQKALPNKEMFKFVVNWTAIKYHKSTIMGGEKIFVHLVDNYFTEELAFWSPKEELQKIWDQANEFRVSMLGQKGKNLKCLSVNGGYEELLDTDAPVVILYIYSYDCDHCRERTPVMKQVYDEWKSKGLEVYALCVDNDVAKLKQFVANYGLSEWENVYDPKYESRYYYKYHIDITPEVYVLDKDRKIIAKDLHPNQLAPTLRRAFQ